MLKWSEVPTESGFKTLALDSSTNSFAENYDKFPSRNFRPILVAPSLNESFDYMTKFEKIQFFSFILLFFVVLGYSLFSENFDHKYLLLMSLFLLLALYPLITLQYDFVGNPSFRVYQDGDYPNYDTWYNSEDGMSYINGYNGLPYTRDRWTEPYFKSEIGINY